jgi:hypothetical protein
MGFRVYETFTPPIDFWANIRRNNGNPINDETVNVSVYDSLDNSEILNQNMPNLGNGNYKFSWRPTFSVEKVLFAQIYIPGNGERRTIIETIDIYVNQNKFLLEEKIDENDGQAV